MIIGIDASRAFSSQRTGTEEYSYQVIKGLLELPEASQHQWILYTRSAINEDWVHKKHILVKHIRLNRLWTQVGLSVATWTDNLDILWVPAHTLPVLRKPGLQTVVTIHGIEYEYLPAFENKLQRWYLPLSTKYAVWSATRLIAVSEFTRGQLIKRLQADSKKITVIHEGTDTAHNEIDRSGALQILSAYNLSSKKYLLFIGTVQPRKNLARLISAFRKTGIKDKKLVIVGKMGWGYDSLPIDTDDQIVFLRYINDREKNILLQNALLYIQPSITEGFGLPILEAFKAEVPVISSFGGALAEVAGLAGNNLFDPLNVDVISEMISRAVDDSSWRNLLIKQGIAKLSEFSWEKAAKETYKILTLR